MKKALLLIAFVVSASWAFANNQFVDVAFLDRQETNDKPCMVCVDCGSLTVCTVASDCEGASTALFELLKNYDCGGLDDTTDN